jgi:two-component system sensor histidine kinase RpfC
MDVHLPDYEGTQLLDALDRIAGVREIPVIALSADATRQRMQELFDRGVAAYVTKPLDTDSLVESVRQALAART